MEDHSLFAGTTCNLCGLDKRVAGLETENASLKTLLREVYERWMWGEDPDESDDLCDRIEAILDSMLKSPVKTGD